MQMESSRAAEEAVSTRMEAPAFSPATLTAAIAHGAFDWAAIALISLRAAARMHGVRFPHLLRPPGVCRGGRVLLRSRQGDIGAEHTKRSERSSAEAPYELE